MDATKRLAGENYVFWGGREGYHTLLNTDLKCVRTLLSDIPLTLSTHYVVHEKQEHGSMHGFQPLIEATGCLTETPLSSLISLGIGVLRVMKVLFVLSLRLMIVCRDTLCLWGAAGWSWTTWQAS